MQIKLNAPQNKVLAGLGNPGTKYENTRHNSGFMFLDFLTAFFKLGKQDVNHKESELYFLDYYPKLALYLLKPQTFMNDSGKAVAEFLQYKNIKTEDLLLIHDDLDLMFGNFKLQLATAPKEHNGVHSVESELGTKDFNRLRIGVDNRAKLKIPGIDYVLQKFNEEELKKLPEIFTEICEKYFSLAD